ncbi:MAG TPA: PAS domain S-box protein [Candidatus Bathyarchaeia archaeon]|nr:PAS domain S-box protein [Candidatus Bathyarchaeia archaeon]
MQNKSRKNRESNFLTLLNFIVDPAVIVDEKGHLLLVNNALEETTGLSKKEIIGKAFFELNLLPPKSKEIILENLKKRMQGLPVEPYEITFTDKNGETRCAEVKAKKIDYAGQPADLVIFRDITRRKQNAKRLKEYAEKLEALVNEKVKEIKESAEKLRSIFDSSPDAITVSDLNRKIIDCNQAKVRMHGFSSKDELIGKSFLELVSPKDRQRVLLCMQEIVKKGSSKNAEWTFLAKDGKEFPVECAASVLKDAIGNPIGYVSITKDITERKKMEEALRESEEKYRTQFEEALDAIVVADAETGIIIDVNRAVSELVGREKSELVGKHQRILHPPKEIEGDFSRTFKQHLKEKEGQILETQVITKRGEIKDVAIKANVFEFRGKKLIQGMFRDITERKKIEAAVAYERDLLHALMDNSPDTIYFKDVASRFTRINRAQALCLRAKDPEEAIGKTDFDYYVEEFAREAYADEQKILKTRKPLVKVEKVKWRDGKSRWVSVTKVPIIDKHGRITGLVGISRDITEIKEMEEKLRQHSEHLEELVQKRTEELKQTHAKLVKSERLAAIGELAGMVGHDLRNPLTGIKGAVYYLKTKYGAELDVKAKEILETVDKAIDYSNKIINDLLDYSKNLTLELVNTTPKLLLKNALSLVEVPERVKIIDAAEGKLEIKADTVNMSRVFVNVITNAIDAMPEGGTLTVTSKAVKGSVEIVFKDTGTGMSKETLSKLKHEFPLFTTKAKGMGLGLPICKRIVEAHGGKISVESTVGKGTTITITIPVNPKPASEGEVKWIFNESVLQAMTTAQEDRER